MATTWIKALHVSKSMAKSTAIAAIIDYANNPLKTDDGKLISSYCCNGFSADRLFYYAKKEYEKKTGRSQGRRDVIAYHIRQSFKPGEVAPGTANKIGYELAMSFTKGQHAFVVCTHIDKAHVHNHIIFNSTSLDYERKFKDFYFSGKAVRRISDLLCVENGLSIIKNPKLSRGSYGDWIGDNKVPSWKSRLKHKIDEVLPSCSTFDEFLSAMKAAGYTVNKNRKYISFTAPGQKRPTRMKSLGNEYSEEAIRTQLGIGKIITSSSDSGTKTRVSLMIDIQAKIQEGKGPGYAQWAKVFNVKEAAKTLIYLKENGIDSYDDLKKKSSSASGDFSALTKKIKEIETRQNEISELQKHIGTYGKTRETFAKYKASGWSRDFYDIHSTDIILHRASKKYFDSLGLKKLPTISQLKQEYSTLANERKTLYNSYHKLKNLSRELSIACHNAERLLDITPDAQKPEIHHSNNQQNR